ncbi:MAG: RNA polymerase sigma factor [Calditrichia bacterium]
MIKDKALQKSHVLQLVEKTKQGDEQAFTELVTIYSDRVYNLALRILRKQDDAADILQETFIKVYEKINTFDGRADFFTWLYRIATNLSLMKLRKEKRTVVTDKDLEEHFDRPDSVEIQKWRDIPLESMLSAEFRLHLDRAVDSLSEIYRSVFVLRDLEGLSIKETSKILNITETNVKVRLKRARMFLREKLAGYMSELVKEA